MGVLHARWWHEEEATYNVREALVTYIRAAVVDPRGGAQHSRFSVDSRFVPAQTLLYEQHEVRGPDLGQQLGVAFGRLLERSDRYRGVQGPALAIYHGQVDSDSDGPVEMAVPIRHDAKPIGDDRIRVEPAHVEAFTSVAKKVVGFPQILTAYDAVHAWIAATAREQIGAPREVYVRPFRNAGPDDMVCEIAIPISEETKLWQRRRVGRRNQP